MGFRGGGAWRVGSVGFTCALSFLSRQSLQQTKPSQLIACDSTS